MEGVAEIITQFGQYLALLFEYIRKFIEDFQNAQKAE